MNWFHDAAYAHSTGQQWTEIYKLSRKTASDTAYYVNSQFC